MVCTYGLGVKTTSVCSINNIYTNLSREKGLHSFFLSLIPRLSLYLPESRQIALLCDSEWVFSSKAFCVFVIQETSMTMILFIPEKELK